jgi:glycerophosphoryl diester phosphodiesterase
MSDKTVDRSAGGFRFLNASNLVIGVLFWLAALPASALDLQGHRGARGLLPENTLPSFARALEIGVTTLELDIAISRDGELVVSHDPALNPDITRDATGRFLSGRGPLIKDTDWAELQRYDVGRVKPGSRTAQAFPWQRAVDGTRLPRMADVFDLAERASQGRIRYAIETKVFPLAPQDTIEPEAFARRVIATIRAAGVASRSTVLSFDWRTLQVVQAEAPEIGTVYVTAQQRWLDNIGASAAATSPWTAGIRFADHGSVPKMIRAAGGRIWSVFFGDLTPALLKEAKDLGLTVLVWTVNEHDHIARMLDLGVDGIVTDYPDRVHDHLERRGLPRPPGFAVRP